MTAAESDGAPSTTEPESARSRDELFFGISAARLRARARWGSIVLALSCALPYEVVGERPLFVWDLASELPLAAVVAAFSLPAAGVAILIALVASRRATSLATTALVALLIAGILRKLGADRAAWDISALPESLSARPAGALVACALTAAAGNLAFRESTRKIVPLVVGAAAVSALYFYAWPSRGEAPLMTVLRALRNLPDLPDVRYQLGVLLIVFVTLWPLLVTGLGALVIPSPPKSDSSWLTILATWVLSGLLFLLAYRAFILSHGNLGLLVYLGNIAVVTAVIAMVSSAVVALIEGFVVESGDEAPASRRAADTVEALASDPFDGKKPVALSKQRGFALSPTIALSIGAVVTVIATGVQAWLSRPPEKGATWEIEAPRPEGDEVYGQLLPKWGYARREWDFAVREEVGARARVEVKARAKELVDGAKGLDPKLGDAFATLTVEADDLDLAGRRWYRLVGDVNESSRLSGQPYFIDPAVFIRTDKDETRYHFHTYSYRIERVSRFDVGGDPYATLHVRALGHQRDSHWRLGFSSDHEPFALVVLEETERYASNLKFLADMGFCTDQDVRHEEVYVGLDRCAKALKDLVDANRDDIAQAVLAATERHELQHQIDGPHLPIAGRVVDNMEAYSISSQDRVNREISAYVAEMTAEGIAPKLALLQLAQHIAVTDQGPYFRAALITFEALGDRSLLRGARVDGAKLWNLFDELMATDDDALRARARLVYDDLFDQELGDPKPL